MRIGNIVSLFDMTGNMVRPLADQGYQCYCFDIQNENMLEYCRNGGSILYLQADLLDKDWQEQIMQLDPRLLFAFPPCTDLAVSGAGHFKTKELANPNYRREAMELVYIARDLGEAIGCPYMIENPVSVISSEWRKPDYIFHPFEYGGYLPEDDVHPFWPEYIVARDAYKKRTCLWVGNGFVMPEVDVIAPISSNSDTYQKLGGKSLKTKNIRSATPRGFAIAVSMFNPRDYYVQSSN